MSLAIMCPACNQASLWNRGPVTSCGKCGAPFPADVRQLAESALEQSSVAKPSLLVIGQYVTGFFGLGFLIVFLSAPFDAGTYTIGTETVSGPEFLRRAGVLFAAVAVYMGAVSLGLWRNRPWTRPLMAVYWPAVAVGMAFMPAEGEAERWLAVFTMLVASLIAAWYLYGNEGVRAYYKAYSTKAAPPPAPETPA